MKVRKFCRDCGRPADCQHALPKRIGELGIRYQCLQHLDPQYRAMRTKLVLIDADSNVGFFFETVGWESTVVV